MSDRPGLDPLVTRLGRYELQECLGSGSFASVYRGYDATLDREVAIKVPHGENVVHDPDRFLREGKRMANLRHPAIVEVHDAAVDSVTGRPYLVMDFIQGSTLRDYHQLVVLSHDRIAELLAHLARGLHHAHQMGVIHRDIKPTNILMNLGGEAFIGDFGLAQAADLDQTIEKRIAGTVCYASPEQLQVIQRTLSPQSDVYALGAMLFELVAGKVPVEANSTVDHCVRLSRGERSDLRDAPGAPKELARICNCCLELYPEDRYPSAQALAEDLDRYRNGIPVLAGGASRLERWLRRIRRNAKTIAITSAVIATMLLLAFGTWQFRERSLANQRLDAANRVAKLLDGPAEALAAALDSLEGVRGNAIDILAQGTEEASPQHQRRAAFGLASLGQSPASSLLPLLTSVPDDEASVYIQLLQRDRDAVRSLLQPPSSLAPTLEDGTDIEDLKKSILLAHAGDLQFVEQLAAWDDAPADRLLLAEAWSRFQGPSDDFHAWLAADLPEDLLALMIEVQVETVAIRRQTKALSNELGGPLESLIQQLARNHPSPTVHGAAVWACGQWGIDWQTSSPKLPLLQFEPFEDERAGRGPRSSQSRWRSLDDGLTMVKLDRDDDLGAMCGKWISMGEVTVAQYRSVMGQLPAQLVAEFAVEPDDSDAVRSVELCQVAEFCNALSDRYQLRPCYQWRAASEGTQACLQRDPKANGFRLPTVNEFLCACEGRGKQSFFFGDQQQSVQRFANMNFDVRRAPTMQHQTNAFGLFDTYGNVAEACHAEDSTAVVYCGGSMLSSPEHLRLREPLADPDQAGFFHLGLRVVCGDGTAIEAPRAP
jgi:hypothetical protein